MTLNDSDLKRFWIKVCKSNDCWLWTKSKNHAGYARFRVGTKTISAHRISYYIANGEIPNGKIVCHSCDVRHCVNPDHLWLGTHKDNTRDCVNKGRHVEVRKTHCPLNHPYSGDNLFIDSNGARQCKICRRLRNRRWQASQRNN